MKRLLALLVAVLMLLGTLASCGEQAALEGESGSAADTEVPPEPVSSEEETEPATEPVETGKYPTEYVAPEDGSFTVCGTPLSEYSFVLYFPSTEDYNRMNRKWVVYGVKDPLRSATGMDVNFTIAKTAKYDTEPASEHEILFGYNFRREGIPEVDYQKNYYGVTADGTVYFCAVSPMVYPYLWELFQEEFFGVAPGSEAPSGGCAISECYREVPKFDVSRLEAEGYSLVLDEPFDGESLNFDLWEYRASGSRRAGYNAASQVSVADGNLILTGEYRTDGEYGEGWYGGMIALKQWYTRGYFEARILASYNIGIEKGDFWSAFWIQGPSPYNPDLSQGGSGDGGAELDIVENLGPNLTTSNVWVSGYEGHTGLDDNHCRTYTFSNTYSEEYHTYALYWDEDVYEFYVDGVMIHRTDFGHGVSHVPEQVILSLEVPERFDIGQDTVRTMYVDYLRIWQKPEQG